MYQERHYRKLVIIPYCLIQYLQVERKTQSDFFFVFFAENKFFLKRPDCPDKTAIMGKTECANACKDLGLPVSDKALNGGFPCYISGRGMCQQNRKHGARALKVCQHKTI